MRYRKLDANGDFIFGHGGLDYHRDNPEAVAQAVSNLPIGDDVLLSRLLCPINESDLKDKRTFDVLALEISRDGEEFSAQNLAIAFNEAAFCDAENISLPGAE